MENTTFLAAPVESGRILRTIPAGAEMLAVGTVAAAVSYAVGALVAAL